MRVIIAGSRTIIDYDSVKKAIEASGFSITEVVSGGASGADRVGEIWASMHDIPTTVFKADWETYGRGAGPIRNQKMVEYSNALIAIWDGSSKGTADVVRRAKRKGLKVFLCGVTNG